MWLASCTVLLVTAVLVAMSVWTIVSYQRTLSDLQERLHALETEHLNLDQIVENKVNYLLDKVSIFITFRSYSMQQKFSK